MFEVGIIKCMPASFNIALTEYEDSWCIDKEAFSDDEDEDFEEDEEEDDEDDEEEK